MEGLNKVIGYNSVKKELLKVLDMLNNKEEYEKLGIKTPRGMLLYGVPGVGKTLIANAFIEESNRNVIVCSKSKVTDNFANYIRESFNEACKRAPSIILLDDMDKFSNEDSNKCDSEEYVTNQSCIDDKKEFDVFVVATANNISKLPYSLRRKGRFDLELEIRPPKGNESSEIIKHYLNSKQFEINVDIDFIVKVMDGKSCAVLESVINRAAQNALVAKRKIIEKEDVIEACLNILYSSIEVDHHRPKENIERVAYHEAGHVLVSEILKRDSIVLVSIKNFDSIYGGITSFYQDDSYWASISNRYDRIVSLLGGMAATMYKFKERDSGALSDLERVYKIAINLVTRNLVSSFDLYDVEESNYSNSNISLYKQNKVYSKIIEKCYRKALMIIKKNSKLLDNLTKSLLEKEVLISSDIKTIIEGR